jgi:tRNA dimethylallyltransferase
MTADRTPLQPSPDAVPAPETFRSAATEATTLAWPPPGPSRRPELAADCWFLSGPTAAGKTALGILLARELGAEIVSVDSMAVYLGLDAGTAKPTAEQRRAVPHHLLDVVSPAEPYSVARWLGDAAAAVADCRRRGRKILFVGGTPLYLRALRDGLADLPGEDPDLRRRLAAEAAAHGSAHLHARLAAVDPATASRLHPNDLKRIIRALEVERLSGRPLSQAFAPEPHPVFERQFFVLDLPRPVLYERIDRRVERMFAEGIVEETRAALAAPGGLGPTAIQAAGYAEAADLLAGHIDRAEAIRRTQQRTRQLAKRQLTWLRSFEKARWIPA